MDFDFLQVEHISIKKSDLFDSSTSNRQRILFDLEGTLNAATGDILQIAAIITDWDFNIKGVYNRFYKNNKPIGESEFKVHKISQEKIDEVAVAHFTESLDDLPLITDVPTMFMSYKTFDVRRVNEELQAYGKPLINFGPEVTDLAYIPEDTNACHFDAYTFGRTRGTVVAKNLGEEAFDEIYEELKQFGDFEKLTNHDALYDAVMILALARRA